MGCFPPALIDIERKPGESLRRRTRSAGRKSVTAPQARQLGPVGEVANRLEDFFGVLQFREVA